jgi:hypothetical protein
MVIFHIVMLVYQRVPPRWIILKTDIPIVQVFKRPCLASSTLLNSSSPELELWVAASVMEIISEILRLSYFWSILETSSSFKDALKTFENIILVEIGGTYLGTVLKPSRKLLKAKSFPSAQI